MGGAVTTAPGKAEPGLDLEAGEQRRRRPWGGKEGNGSYSWVESTDHGHPRPAGNKMHAGILAEHLMALSRFPGTPLHGHA